jgi:dolichyl-phosphate beta-glucosyltransferase
MVPDAKINQPHSASAEGFGPKRGAPRTCIVVPCYNEENRFNVAAFEAYLESTSDIHFTLVNDGSSDGTLSVLHALAERWPNRLSVVDQQPNRGKAEAVRVGMIHGFSKGACYVGYFDADLATPLEAISELTRVLEEHKGIDIVLGARIALLGHHIERSPVRHYAGRVFATAASAVLDLPVYDTQCGAKLFRVTPQIRGLFNSPFGSRWIFDVELLARYLAGGGSREGIYELALQRWADVGDSKLRSTDFLRAAAEMATIYRNYRLPNDKRRVIALLSAPILRYVGAGAVGTLVHYCVLAVCVELLHISPPLGALFGALCGAAVNYLLNYHVTFASTALHRHTLPRFAAVAAFLAAVNTAGMWLATRHYHLHWLVAQIVCTIVVLLVGYLLNKAWTFSARLSMRATNQKRKQPLQRASDGEPAPTDPSTATPQLKV